ncbi:hypothetical protein AVEN_157022-1 [Araneus ventricosus]|uniref:Uncharacterized protein n=1 Tax=Araneus ventricosus TaxID=182803 RepID=A0A4Y2GWG6_ARAVE|nr:hypothetical protein AVEN_157022-1 [Araneus ventricosus]
MVGIRYATITPKLYVCIKVWTKSFPCLSVRVYANMLSQNRNKPNGCLSKAPPRLYSVSLGDTFPKSGMGRSVLFCVRSLSHLPVSVGSAKSRPIFSRAGCMKLTTRQKAIYRLV